MMSGYPSKPSTLAFDETGTLLATGGSEIVTVWVWGMALKEPILAPSNFM